MIDDDCRGSGNISTSSTPTWEYGNVVCTHNSEVQCSSALGEEAVHIKVETGCGENG